MTSYRPAALLFALLAAPSLAAAQSFTVIGLPDTQNYSELYPEIFALQTSWTASQIEPRAIRFVSHYGDVVQNGDQTWQWVNSVVAMNNLDMSGVPYGLSPGNHDITPSGTPGASYIPQFFTSYYSNEKFAGKSWFGGMSPSGMSSYQVFTGGGLAWLALHVECDGAMRELEWAQAVLDRHRDLPAFLTTHRYLQDAEDYTFGVPLVPSGLYPEIWYTIEDVYAPDGNQATQIADWFVRRNPNLFLVNCGHFHEEYRQSGTNVAGNTYYEVLADYQDDPNGGDGWLRIMEFDPANDQVRVDSYSPFLNAFRFADESSFTLSVDFDRYFSTEPTAVFQQEINGYFGTQDTWINEASPNTSYGGSDVRVSDDDTINSFFGDERGQALVRFDGLISNEPGRVPPGAQIDSAWLTLEIANDIDNPLFSPNFFVHRVNVAWDESSTWNSLGGGLSGGELGPVLATFSGDNSPNSDGLRRINVTQAVQDWANGQPNWGFAILPEIISGNDDGIEIFTSEASNPLLRPRLEVTFAADCGFEAYGAPAPANVLSLAGFGLPRAGGRLVVETAPAPAAGAFTAYGFAPADLPLLGGRVLVDLSTLGGVFATPTFNGTATAQFPLPNSAAVAGLDVYLQSFALDGSQPGGIAFSNGVRARLCQ
jgi:hypothetical protein